jgi:hypothetical protein
MATADSDTDDEAISLFTSKGLKAAARAEAGHAQLVAEGPETEERALPSSTLTRPLPVDKRPLLVPTSKAPALTRSPSPLTSPEDFGSGSAPSSAAATSTTFNVCPDSVQVPLQWDQVLYWTCPITNKLKYDSKTSPITLPHPDLQFRGYVFSGVNVSAHFTSSARDKKGLRHPSKPSGGKNKRYFEGLKNCKSDDECKRFKKDHAGEYTPRHQRFGATDPDL